MTTATLTYELLTGPGVKHYPGGVVGSAVEVRVTGADFTQRVDTGIIALPEGRPLLVFGDQLVPISRPERFGVFHADPAEYVRRFAMNEPLA